MMERPPRAAGPATAPAAAGAGSAQPSSSSTPLAPPPSSSRRSPVKRAGLFRAGSEDRIGALFRASVPQALVPSSSSLLASTSTSASPSPLPSPAHASTSRATARAPSSDAPLLASWGLHSPSSKSRPPLPFPLATGSSSIAPSSSSAASSASSSAHEHHQRSTPPVSPTMSFSSNPIASSSASSSSAGHAGPASSTGKALQSMLNATRSRFRRSFSRPAQPGPLSATPPPPAGAMSASTPVLAPAQPPVLASGSSLRVDSTAWAGPPLAQAPQPAAAEMRRAGSAQAASGSRSSRETPRRAPAPEGPSPSSSMLLDPGNPAATSPKSAARRQSGTLREMPSSSSITSTMRRSLRPHLRVTRPSTADAALPSASTEPAVAEHRRMVSADPDAHAGSVKDRRRAPLDAAADLTLNLRTGLESYSMLKACRSRAADDRDPVSPGGHHLTPSELSFDTARASFRLEPPEGQSQSAFVRRSASAAPLSAVTRRSDPAAMPTAAAAAAHAGCRHSGSISRLSLGKRTSGSGVASRKTRRQLIALLESWDFEPEELLEADLISACTLIFEAALRLPASIENASDSTTIGEALNISLSSVRTFISSISHLYDPTNAYHNFVHAADVLQALAFFLTEIGAMPPLRQLLTVGGGLDSHRATIVPAFASVSPASTWDPRGSPLQPADTLALLFAAIGHDAGHAGLSNAFLNNAGTVISKAFDAKSPLENLHALMLEECMAKQGLKHLLWEQSDSESFRIPTQFAQLMRTCILSTDMALHCEYVSAIEELQHKVMSGDAASIRRLPREDITTLCCAMLKCSDICNPARNIAIGRQWSVNLRREWARQMDVELCCGLPLTVGLSPNATHRERSNTSQSDDSSGSCQSQSSARPGSKIPMVRRQSAAQAVASAGGGGGSSAAMADPINICCGTLPTEVVVEEASLAKGQVFFVNLFVLPLFTAIASVLPAFERLSRITAANNASWKDRLSMLEARLEDTQIDSASAPPDPEALDREMRRVGKIFLPLPDGDLMDRTTALALVHAHAHAAVQAAIATSLNAADALETLWTEDESNVTQVALPATTTMRRQTAATIMSSPVESERPAFGASRPASITSLSTHDSYNSQSSFHGTIFSQASASSTAATSSVATFFDAVPAAALAAANGLFAMQAHSPGAAGEQRKMSPVQEAPSKVSVETSIPCNAELSSLPGQPLQSLDLRLEADTRPSRLGNQSRSRGESPAASSPLSIRRVTAPFLGLRPPMKRASTATVQPVTSTVGSSDMERRSSAASHHSAGGHSLPSPRFSIRRVSLPWLYGSSVTTR